MDNKLFVGNLPYSVTGDDLKAMFSSFGTVESAEIITDRMSGRSKGFGFVTMSTPDEAQAAIAGLNESEQGGRKMIVAVARPKAEGDRGPRAPRSYDDAPAASSAPAEEMPASEDAPAAAAEDDAMPEAA